MEGSDHSDSIADDSGHGWMQHMVRESILPDHFPISSGPVVYEGFIPQGREPASQYPQLNPHFANDVAPRFNLEYEQSSTAPTPTASRGRRPRGRPRGRAGIRGGWNRGTKMGPRPTIDPGAEFNSLHKDATEALLVQQDLDKAQELILKAININPEIYSAHMLLSEIYFARNDEERGIAALLSGAHAAPNDSTVWHQLADTCLARTTIDRTTMLKQASYCFQRLLQIDRMDHDARFQKAAIQRQLGQNATALKDFEYLLQKMPHNSSILQQIADICLEIRDEGRAIGHYDAAIEHQRLAEIVTEDAFTWGDLVVYVDLFARPNGAGRALKMLSSIARWLLGRENETYWDGVDTDDREWDAEDSPRRVEVSEFQSGRYPLDSYGLGLPIELRIKLGILRLKTDNRQEALNHFEWLAPEARDENAPLHQYTDLFLQVADALREIKEYEQALRYYEALLEIKACEDLDFWLGIGACLFVCEKKDQALYCYEEAKAVDPTSAEARIQLSKLYASKGDREQALTLAREAIKLFEGQASKTVRRKYERRELREAREAAQKVYKDAYRIPRNGEAPSDHPAPQFSKRAQDRARRAARAAAAAEAAASAEAGQSEDERDQELFESLERRERVESARRIKKNTRKEVTARQRHESVQQLFSTLSGVTDSMRKGDDVSRNIWMDCAEVLIEQFRQQKAFYPPERYVKFCGFDSNHRRFTAEATVEGEHMRAENIPIPSVESNVPFDYCGISFSEWLDIFLEYAIILANIQDDNIECYAVINAAIDCNVWYHDPNAMFQIHSCWLACAVALRDELTLFNIVLRWFMREFTFCTDVYRLFAAFNFYFPLSNDKGGKSGQMNTAVFRSGPNQKFLFRQVMHLDSQLPEDYGAELTEGSVPAFMRKNPSEITYASDRIQHRHNEQRARNGTSESFEELPDAEPDDEPLLQDNSPRSYSPKELDVVLLTIYAQILYAGNSFPNALSYFYRAYSVDPKNTVVLLSIALSYLHQLLKRQNENRHMYMLQGWSFFEKYADARIEWAERTEKQATRWSGKLVTLVKKEIEFNRARCWQMLGMSDLAIRSYGKMLDMQIVKREEDAMELDEGRDDDERQDVYSMEAAYAMSTMYAVSGDFDSAKALVEKYLVVE